MSNVLKPEFKSFESISRLKRGCAITEKIDGTNGLIWIDDNVSEVHAGSRNKWVTPQDDNAGWAKWVEDLAEELKRLGPGYHYGEWWGGGIQRRYGLKEKRFSLFNTGRWLQDGVRHSDVPECCHIVPLLYVGDFSTDTVEACLEKLRTEGSIAAPGFMNPEGVVVYMTQARKLFKVTLDGDGHKGAK